MGRGTREEERRRLEELEVSLETLELYEMLPPEEWDGVDNNDCIRSELTNNCSD